MPALAEQRDSRTSSIAEPRSWGRGGSSVGKVQSAVEPARGPKFQALAPH